MINFICADGKAGGNIVIYVILIVALVAMLVLPYFTQRKKNQEYMKMLDAIKVGDLVKTAGGIIGKVNKISDKGEIKTVILETGSKTEKSYMEFDMSMIYCVLKSSKVEKEESEVSEEPKAEVVEEAKVEEAKAEEPKAEEVAEEKAEEKKAAPKKKATKTTTKKTTKK